MIFKQLREFPLHAFNQFNMKYSCLTGILSGLLALGLQAQSNQYWGLVYSPALMEIAQGGKSTDQNWLGHQACLTYQWHAQKRWSYRAGIGYAYLQREYKSSKPYAIDNQVVRYRHQDLLLPFQWQYSFPKKTNKFYASGGLLVAINVDREVLEYWRLTNEAEINSRELSSEQDYKRLDVQLSLGLGYIFHWDKGNKLVIQPSFRSNILTVLAYFPQEYLGSRLDPGAPPLLHVIGLELGYFFHK